MTVCCTAKSPSNRRLTTPVAPVEEAGVPPSIPLGAIQFPTKPMRYKNVQKKR